MSSTQCDKDAARQQDERKKSQDHIRMRLSGEVRDKMIGVHDNSDAATDKEHAAPKMKCKPSHLNI